MKYGKIWILSSGLLFASASLFTAPLLSEETSVKQTEAEANYAKGKKLYDQKQYRKAFPYLRKAAEAGHSDAQMHLGKMYYNGWGVGHNHETGRKWHEKAAAQGNKESIRKLESMDHH